MMIIYDVSIHPTKLENRFRITWKNIKSDTNVSFEQEITMTKEELQWLWQMPRQRAIIGEKLFHFLDGTEHHFQQALEKAHRKGTSLFFYLHTCKETANWPFELLAKDGIFLLPEKLHLVRYIPGKIKEKTKAILPKNRPLKLLFMACSVMDTQPELDFEKEEEAIFHITEELPIEMDVEDSGSLPGLLEKLNRQSYDIIHLSGHAGVDQDGQPYFVMEDETGGEHQVFPDRLWNEALIKNPPRLIILSGSPAANIRALSNTSAHEIKRPFAHILVEKYNIPAVLEWNLKVNDEQAILAGKMIYLELSKGCSIFEAVQRARHELSIKFFHHVKAAWPLLKLYASAVPLNGLVRKEQNYSPKTRRMKHIYLKNSRVKVLEDGFVGRRRQVQQSLRGLKTGTGKVGLLIMGTGGLGKSCLAGKISERFSSHTLIIIQGKFNTLSLNDGLKDAFIISQDEKGKSILAQAIEMKDKLIHLCTTCFKERNYLFLLDDFEKNMEGFEKGEPGDLFTEAADLLGVLLHYLPFCDNKSQIIITSRYEFSLPYQERDIIDSQLEKIWLTGFTKNEQRKKLPALSNISKLENREIAGQLLAAGYGNPRLMEWIDILTKQLKINEVETLAAVIKDKQEEFIRAHIIRELLKKGGVSLGRFLQWFSIYRIPVFEDGVFIVAKKARIKDWKKLLRKGMSLSLAEHDQARKSFQVTPLLREELLKGIKNHLPCHKAGFTYFKKICEAREVIDPVLTEEWIYHALGCKEEEVSSRQAGRLVEYLRNMLAFQESRRVGLWVLNEKKLKLHAKYDSFLLNEFAYTIDFLGEHKKAISYYQQALVIDLELFGEKHPNVAIRLSNMGEAWRLLGDAKKAIGFYVKALVIDRELLGEKHPNVAVRLHNIGSAWYELDEFRQSVGYYEQAKNIWENFYGENHQNVATVIINLGEAWRMIGDIEKAINYYKKGLAIFIKVYGEEHQDVAAALKKLGTIYDDLGEYYQSIGYYEQAYFIHMSILGERHPDVAADLNGLGAACQALGEIKKAINYYTRALLIWKDVYGERHSTIATGLNNLGMAYQILGELQDAIKHYERALSTWKALYGEKHSTVANCLNNLGLAWQDLGEFKKAVDHFEQALSIWRNVFWEKHSTIACVMNNLGLAWQNLGEFKKAIQFFQQAMIIGKEVFGDYHNTIATSMNNLGLAWKILGEYEKAIHYYEQSLIIFQKIFGKKHHYIATLLNNLGEVWKASGDARKAITYYEMALSIDQEIFGKQHAKVAIRMNNLGAAWQALNDLKKAVSYYEQALAIDKAVFGSQHPDVAIDLNNLGEAWRDLGESHKAIMYYQQALDIATKTFGEMHPTIAVIINNIGSAYFDSGQEEKAKVYFEKSYNIKLSIFGPDHPSLKLTAKCLELTRDTNPSEPGCIG